MKRLILLSLFIVSTLYCKAEQPYQPWETFKGDTLQYLKVNFEQNKDKYIGHRLEKVVNDYELPIKYLRIPPNADYQADGVVFSYISGDDMFYYIGPENPVLYIAINFENKLVFDYPIVRDEITKKRIFDNREVMMKKLKNAIVKTIEVRTYYE